MKVPTIIVLPLILAGVSAFGGDDKFIKKYAMMKIYESCFGPEVVKQIRKEMKTACAKCAAFEQPPTTPAPPPQEDATPQNEGNNPAGNSVYQNQQPIDVEKLHQAILAYRPNVPQPQYRPYPNVPGYPSNFYNPVAFGNPAASGYPMFYNPTSYQSVPFSPYGPLPVLGQQYFGNRMSRDMDIKGQLDVLASKMSGKVRNVTCVMQELGYLDENLEPNYNKISERIGNLPVNDELKRDIQDGVTFCQQFSQCVPEVNKDKSPLSRELIRPMFFFKCYKHKKLEACIMKDVREKYSGVADDELEGDVEVRRQGKSTSFPEEEREIDDLATSMYEFLYASDSRLDLDSIL